MCRGLVSHHSAMGNTMSSESKCHFRGVIFCCVPGALPLHKRRGILLRPGAFQGAFQENDTCFPLFCCVCNLRGGSQETPQCSQNTQTKNDTFENDTWTRNAMAVIDAPSRMPDARSTVRSPVFPGSGAYPTQRAPGLKKFNLQRQA